MNTFLARFAVSVGVSSPAAAILASAFDLGMAGAVVLLVFLTAITLATAAFLTSDFLAAAVRGEHRVSRAARRPARLTVVSVLWGAIRIETGPAPMLAMA